ncbi:MAG: hypothetical protein KAI64_05200 [Thermoplasmata archaeon]|nr:hypothetical protein [Thermoplasmata archaeon]MCK5548389.1 hypothetical protein [Thermoplasmata archaeon]
MVGETFNGNNVEISIWDNFRGLFSTGNEYSEFSEENIKYKRRFFDKNIEVFLDKNFNDYVQDFGILDETTLEIMDERASVLDGRSRGLLLFIKEADEGATILEKRVEALEKASKKK